MNTIKRNRKLIGKVTLIVVVLGITAAAFYKLGANQAAANPKAKTSVTAPNAQKLKDIAKNASKNTADSKAKVTTATTNSSGFFRLAGTVQAITKTTISTKLADGTVVTLAINDKTKFYSATPRTAKPISELKTGTSTLIIGSIGANGTFTASNIQAQK